MKPTDDVLFQLEQVGYTYVALNTPPQQALKNIDLNIKRGEFVAIIGPSGSGKSTLMHILGIMSDPDSGVFKINSQSLHDISKNDKARLRNETFGFLFQQYFLLPQLSVIDNILLPAEYQHGKFSEDTLQQRAADLIERFGLSGQEHKRPSQLSGGQRQRVALCRALVMDPDVLMCDEPTGALDSVTASEVLTTLQELHTEGRTIIVITHDPDVARRAHRIIRIVDGRIVSDTTNQESRTSNPFPNKHTHAKSKTHSRPKLMQISSLLKNMFYPTLQALRTQKLRTALTMTGLLLGVSSVYIMLTMTGRVGQIFEDFFATQGSRKAFVSFDGRLAERTGANRWRGLNVKTELPKLNEQIKTFGRLDPNIDTGGCSIISPSANFNGSLTGLNSLLEMRENDLRLALGRLPLPNEFSLANPARIALLGRDAAVKLFPSAGNKTNAQASILGRTITIRGCEYEGILTVVGILKPIDSLFDRDVNSAVYVPSQTLLAGGLSMHKSRLTAVPNSGVNPTWFAKYVVGKLRLMTGDQFPFRYFAAEQELAKFNLMMNILTGLTLVIGALCTLIGGIGVMNIMLVNVRERIQEIGIRKAVGAQDSHIRTQFLLESTGLCMTSGALGLGAGFTLSVIVFEIAKIFLPRVETLTHQLGIMPTTVSLAVSLGAGLLFGTWPARTAAELNIVDALKQE